MASKGTLQRRREVVTAHQRREDLARRSTGNQTLHALRPLVFSIAYRMLGTVTDAEDVMQEAMLRIHRGLADGVQLRNPDAFATTVTTRLALDAVRAAARRRETYVGAWLPEPILVDDTDPAHRLEIDDAISLALLAVLQRLSPAERAVFLLRDTFGYDYPAIAEILDRSEAACRQLFSRAQRHVIAAQIRFEPSAAQRAALASAFFAAIQAGDVRTLESLLATDALVEADGGGRAPARRTPLTGRTAVARFLLGLSRQGERHGIRTARTIANGQPAALFTDESEAVLGVMCLDIRDGVVTAVHSQINPDKLAHLGTVGDLSELLSGRP